MICPLALHFALEEARHAAGGAIWVWGKTEPEKAKAMSQIQKIYEGHLKKYGIEI